MKNKFLLALLSIMLVVASFSLFACGSGDGDVYIDLTTQSFLYDMGEQEIAISFKDSSSTFRQTISKNDVELGDALEGLTVKDVKYVNETQIVVSLYGTAKKRVEGQTLGKISVKPSGKKGKGTSVCYMSVSRPAVSTVHYVKTATQKDGVTTYSVSGNAVIDVGAFTEKAAKGSVSLADGVTGDLSVALKEDGSLEIKITNCNKLKPEVVIGKDATTFGIEIILPLGSMVNF